MVPERQLFIDGSWVAPQHGRRMDVVCPSDESRIGTIAAATPEDAGRAVTAAYRAYKRGEWSGMTGLQRSRFLRAIAKKITEKKSYLAKLEAMDMGKPISEAEWDMDDVAGCFTYYADLAEQLDSRQNEHVTLPDDSFDTKLLRQPLGVVALITPWNYPLLMAAWKVAPALAAGCTCVLKPSEMASLTCLELAAICEEVGLPGGVLNLVTGTGIEAGAPLTSNPLVAKVAFTGSVTTGRRVALAAAAMVRPCSLELGGKSALMVFEDADVPKAVEWAMFGSFWTNGQICSATSRLLLHESIFNEFCRLLKQRAETIQVGNPLDADCRMGPIVEKQQYQKILSYIEKGKAEGATLLTGGSRPPHCSKGYFVQPTVFVDVRPDMAVWKEEIFGPVLSVATFRTESEALALANDSEYGLGGAVISACPQRCKRVAAALECGIVWVNCSQPCFVQAPWGGIKNSGYGRELGPFGLNNFLSIKQVTTYVSSAKWDWYPDTQQHAAKL